MANDHCLMLQAQIRPGFHQLDTQICNCISATSLTVGESCLPSTITAHHGFAASETHPPEDGQGMTCFLLNLLRRDVVSDVNVSIV
jgi:hypothetical protein